MKVIVASVLWNQLSYHLFQDMLIWHTQKLETLSQVILIVFLVLLSGLFSGLNLGLMSLDQLSLEIVIGSGTAKESKFAKRIYPIRKRGNLLLCTILLGNVSVNTLLSILMASFTSGAFGFLASTAIIVIFGEIVPQAFCSRHSLTIGYYSVWIVWMFLIVLLPISYPISKILDYILGRELGTIYTRNELKKLLDMHSTYSDTITKEEVSILAGALDFSSKRVDQVMTSIKDAYMININDRLTAQTIKSLLESGFSRIPVYENEKKNIVGMFYVKDLALVNPDIGFRVGDIIHIIGRKFPKVVVNTKLSEMLTVFKECRCHISLVYRFLNEPQSSTIPEENEESLDHSELEEIENVGLVTLEDLFEEILQSEINDETDIRTDNRTLEEITDKNRTKVNYDKITEDEDEEIEEKLFETLRTLPEFSDEISPAVLRSLIEQSTKCRVEEGDVIYNYNNQYDYCTVLVQGSILIRRPKKKKEKTEEEIIKITSIDKIGICFGLQAIFNGDDEHWSSDIIAVAKDCSITARISKHAYFAAVQATHFQHDDVIDEEEDNF